MGRFEVYRGLKDIMQLGEVVRFDDEDEVDAWDGECNKIIGTDSTMYVENKPKSPLEYETVNLLRKLSPAASRHFTKRLTFFTHSHRTFAAH